MAAVLLETDLPEPPDTELPWGTEEVRGLVGAATGPELSLFDARAA